MKSKVLFSALLGGFVLASCTADETLVSAPGSQESPIKFSVSLENDALTKADITSDMKVNFEAGDLMSLFHGITSANLNALSGFQNAIYEGSAKNDEAFEFTTKSMVLEGGAIMVYPADTTFANKVGGSAAPVITIPTEQNAKTKELTPHMSEVLKIGAYDEDSNEGTAGYGKYYGIVLKRVGTTFKLTADLENTEAINNLDVEPLKVTSMELNAEDVSSNGVFTTAISVKNSTTPVTSAIKADYPIWNTQSTVDLTTAPTGVTANAATLTTTDLTDNAAVFTLLPTMTGKTATEASVVVKTNYGKVTLNKDAEVWTASGAADAKVLAGINSVLNNTWRTAGAESVFAGQKVAGYGQRGIKVDVKDLDMDGLHITDENHLMDALTVYDAIANEAAVTWILDGNEDGEFVMNAEAAAAYEARVADEDNKISFKRNRTDADKTCDVVKFVATELTEVPAVLKFVGENPSSPVAQDKPSVVLVGPWKYTNDDKAFTLISDITVAEGATLQVSGTVGATPFYLTNFSIINNGAITVDGTTDLALSLTNNGSINIPEGAQLFVAGNNVTLTNDATALNEFGTISNEGNLGIRENATSGVINNYGYIKQENEDAYTYVTNNATASANFANAFSATNKIGTIELNGTGNVNTTVADANRQGFIKVTTTAATVSDTEVGTVANYVVITGDCTNYKATADNVKYVDVQSSKRVVFNVGNSNEAYELTGLVVGANYSINIPVAKNVEVTTTYLKGYIYYAGEFTSTNFGGYLGTADNNNVIYQGQ